MKLQSNAFLFNSQFFFQHDLFSGTFLIGSALVFFLAEAAVTLRKNKKIAILALSPTLNLTLALILTLILTQTQNLTQTLTII